MIFDANICQRKQMWILYEIIRAVMGYWQRKGSSWRPWQTLSLTQGQGRKQASCPLCGIHWITKGSSYMQQFSWCCSELLPESSHQSHSWPGKIIPPARWVLLLSRNVWIHKCELLDISVVVIYGTGYFHTVFNLILMWSCFSWYVKSSLDVVWKISARHTSFLSCSVF